jgi:hypothetical protein
VPRDYFAILGLTPGVYRPAEIQHRFQQERARLLAQLADAATHQESRRQLDELHLAYRALLDAQRQEQHLASAEPGTASRPDRALVQLSALIADSLEDGLLRYSRRQAILAEGRRLGFSDFQVHLLIAQVQFGSVRPELVGPRQAPPRGTRRGALLAAAVLLAGALFLLLKQSLGV